MKTFRSLAAIVLVLNAHAETLTWQSAVEYAKKNNAELQTALANVRVAEDKVKTLRGAYFPTVSANVTYRDNATHIDNFPQNGNGKNYAADITATQNLFAGLVDFGNVQQAEGQVKAAEAALQITKAKVSFDLTGGFQGVIYAREFSILAEDIVKRRLDNMRLVTLRYEGGGENKGSVLLSEAYYKQAQLDALHSKNIQRTAQAALAIVLGAEDYLSFDVQGTIPEEPPPSVTPNFRALVSRTPAYAQAFANERAAQSGITIARGAFLPHLDLNAGIGKNGPDFFPERENHHYFGVSFTLPIFNGGKDFYATSGAIENYAAVSSTLSTVSRQMVNTLENSYATFLESTLKLDSDGSFRNAANVRAEIARKKYNTGLLTFEDWDVIENDLIGRQKDYLTSERDRKVAEAAWHQSLGEGVIK